MPKISKEKFLEDIFNVCEDPMYAIDPKDYTIVLANTACNFGKLTEKTTCYSLTHHQKEKCEGVHPCPVSEVVRTKKTVMLNHMHYDKEGKEKFVELYCYPILDDKKEVVFVLERERDITKQKETKVKIDQQDRFLLNILDALTFPFYVVDAESYKITLANATASKGKPLHDVTCHLLTHKINKPCENEHVCPLNEVKKTKKPVITEHIHYENDEPRNKEVHGYPVVNEEGKISEMIEYSIDITERKKAEEKIKLQNSELKDVNQKLIETNNLKDMFMDIMRHDILNPLAVIKDGVAMLEENLKIDKKVCLSNMFRSANSAIEIIENATKYAKIELSGTLETTELDLQKVISDVVNQVLPRYKSKGVDLINRVNKQIILQLNPLISEVFLNLLTNALKYASEGKRVIIETEKRGPYLLIKIIDFGEGVPDEYKEAIFCRFSRKGKEGVKGTGLGLAIVAKIVKLHQGEVWVEDNSEGGSVFVVSIPCTPS